MRFDLIICGRGMANEVILLENEKPQEYYFEWKNKPSIIGNIYKGVVEKVVKAINSAFINIGLEKNGFLFGKDIMEEWLEYAEIFGIDLKKGKAQKIRKISSIIREGQTLIVKVQRGEISTKGPRLTTFITIPGNFTVLLPYLNFIGISKKIEDKRERERLKEIAKKAMEISGRGIIIRTISEGKAEEVILQDFYKLNFLWENIEKEKEIKRAPAILYKGDPLYIRVLRDFLSYPFQYIWVDEKKIYEELEEFLKNINPKHLKVLKYYEKSKSIKEELNISKDLESIFKNKIWLKKGGHIIINQTEALCSIDVNSGKFISGDNISETALKTNLEAIKEIVKQIRLRDIGGIIVVDFIDMDSKKFRQEILESFKNEMKRDRSSYRILRLSDFGILEMTRKRLYESKDSFILSNCFFCEGEGKVKNTYKIAQEIFEEVLKKYSPFKEIKVKVYCSKETKKTLMEKEWVDAFKKIKVKLKVKEDKNLKLEEFKVI